MIRSVNLGEVIVITTKNKVGLLADISSMLSDNGINIEAVAGYATGATAKVLLITSANLTMVGALKRKKYRSVKELEVVIIDLEDKPGALKVVTTELKKKKIDIKYLYVTACSCKSGCISKMVLQTSDNETAIALLSKYAQTTD